MKVSIDRAPDVIEHCLDMVERYKVDYERWMQKADAESDPESRLYLEQMADGCMDVVNSSQLDAEQLIEQLKAAGRPYRRKH